MQQNAPLILQVEDEDNIRKLITVNMVQRGYRVLEACTGLQGLQLLRDETPDLLVLNIRLPDMSGLDILEHLNDNSLPASEFPVLIITAFPIDTEMVLRQYPRVARIFTKPFDIKEVIDCIHENTPQVER